MRSLNLRVWLRETFNKHIDHLDETEAVLPTRFRDPARAQRVEAARRTLDSRSDRS